MKQLLHETSVVCVVACPSRSMPLMDEKRHNTSHSAGSTPESNPLKYLQSKNECKFWSMMGFEPGTFWTLYWTFYF
jgi:hypothetical protein